MATSAPDREAIIARLEEIRQELVAIRRMLEEPQPQPAMRNNSERLFGSLGHGSWDEYDSDLDWARFSTP